MTSKTFEKAIFAMTVWRAAKSDNIDELLAVASTLRNRVLRYGKPYMQILEQAEVNRPWPSIQHPSLIDPQSGLLAQIDDVYDNIAPDYTSNHLQKNGALYFARAVEHHDTGDWFDANILDNPNEHPLIGTWGSQQFYV